MAAPIHGSAGVAKARGAVPAELAAELGLQLAGELDSAPRPSAPALASARHILPVTSDISALLPHGGLSAMTTITSGRIGATSLLWRTLAGPSSAGAWCAVVGLERLYPLAARAAGVDLERLALVEAAGPRIVDAAGALASGIPVLVVPSAAFTPAQTRRLAAKCRRSGTAIVWWESRPVTGADARLEVSRARWKGLRPNSGRRYGAGRLTACELDVASRWRGGLTRRAAVWPYGRPPDSLLDMRGRP